MNVLLENSSPSLSTAISLQTHLKEQLSVRPGMCEAGGVVIFIQYGDMSSAGGTPRWRSPVLHDHNKLVAGLLLSVQGEAGTDLT